MLRILATRLEIKHRHEVFLASIEGKALHSKVKLVSKGRVKIAASPCEPTLSGEAILVSPIARRKAFKTKPKASQPKGASFQSSRVSVLDQLGPINTDLRDYLSNKRKLCFEKLVHISPSQCGQVGCQLDTVHSVHYCLGIMPITLLSRQSVFNWLLGQISEKTKSRKKNATKVVHLAASSVNMISRGRNLFRSRRRRQGTFTPPTSTLDSDYNPGLSQILVEYEGAFHGTHSRVTIPYNYR